MRHIVGKCECGFMHYFAAARNAAGKIEQLFVSVRQGHATTQDWTGKIYATDAQAKRHLWELNKNPGGYDE